MSDVDSNSVWIRRRDSGKWDASWEVAQFIRDLTAEQDIWRRLFAGEFAELIGVQAEIAIRPPNRTCIWFSGDAAPSCIGGANWASEEFSLRAMRNSWPLSYPPTGMRRISMWLNS